MRMKRKFAVPMLLVMVLLAGCATLQDQWAKATTQEKAQLMIGQYQGIIKNALVVGQAYVDSTPLGSQARKDWVQRVVPMIEVAKGVTDSYIAKGKAGQPFTYEDVVLALSGKVSDIQKILLTWGITI